MSLTLSTDFSIEKVIGCMIGGIRIQRNKVQYSP